ncbi:MAG: 1-acyl-sn-glycerol-3-phosphate acyltransferase [Sandaracinaceae bacterium]
MPEPPLLLADRVTGLVGEPGSLGLGTVWTETDVPCDAWYLRAGRMPAGLMIEAGQADLFLASWLGVDLHLGGDRAYRLLGCRLTYHRSPPRPGETLAYDIHIDGHATQGGVRLFFFHYDCHIDGEPALTVREGQAGFFTRGELDESAGILWRPEEQAIAADARVDRPPVRTRRGTFGPTALQALAAGDPAACFGEGFEGTRAHVRTPRIPGGRLQLLDRVEAFDPHGGPWGRGYLRAVQDIRPDDWFFEGHFKNDPCMPGTLMFEGCLAAMAFYLTAMGTTLDRDGWRFEPIPDETYDLVCRGQVIPTSRTLVYELFIEELHDGPVPKLYADLLCTVDGLGAFHARRMGLQLVPDVPGVEAHLAGEADREPVATFEGVPLGRRAILSSALGWPSDAFGPRYRGFDGARRAPRLPGPPYLMISRLTRVATEPFAGREGSLVVAAYDVPPEAWYLEDGAAAGAMPLSLLLEAALQPCGWLASAAGCAIDKAADLRFRNLDGEGTVLGEARPGATLRTEARLVGRSDLPSMVLTTFEVVVRDGETDLYRLRTSFGFFPEEAFASQAGLGAEGSALLEAPGDVVDLRGEPAALFGGSARLASGRLRLLDRAVLLTEGGVRGESDVDPGAWFFSAHFFEDPVQPGSLGVEAMLQLLRFAALQRGLHRGMARPRFTPVAVGRPHRWTYRGQVRPTAKRTAVTIPAVEVTAGPAAAHLEGTASFWVDGTRIYEATIGTDLVEAGADGWPRAGAVHLAEVRSFWRRTLGIGAGAIEDLTSGLLTRFVGSVRVEDPAALDGLRGRSVLYLANHQTAIETLMLSLLAGAYGDRPLITVAKREHEGSWYGRLLGWFFARPAVPDLGLTAYFDRHRPEDLPALLAGLFGRMTEDGRSLLIHAEGTRATTAGAPLGPISGVPLDEAAARGVPVVPVRFMGGLPLTGSAKLDFPYRLAPQDVWVGAPIGAEELAGATYRERQERVRAAIRALGPSEEAPNAPHLAAAHLERRAAELTRAGLERPISILRAVLEAIDDASSETQRILQHLDGDAALERDDPIDRWLASFAHSVAEVR